MLRLIGLQQAMALQARAPGAPCHLREQLKRPLRRARITVGKAEIGIDNADKRHQGKVMSLGDELRANDDISLPLDDGLKLQTQPLDAHEIGREDNGPGLGEMSLHFLSDPLDPRPAGDQMIEGTAFRAMVGRRLAVTALVAL